MGRFEIRVSGHLSERVRAAFPGMDVVEVSEETVISGRAHHGDEVHGVLSCIQSLGLKVVSLQQAPEDSGDEPTHDPEEARP